jgi:hypothetical protein
MISNQEVAYRGEFITSEKGGVGRRRSAWGCPTTL